MAKSELLGAAVSCAGNRQNPAQPIHDIGKPRTLVSTTQGTSFGRSPTRTTATHHETSDTYTGIVAQLCPRHRVVICKDAIQWILQRRDAQRAGRLRWTGIGYFRIVDTLATVRPSTGGRDSQYQSDYGALRGLHALANECGIGIIVVHHVRKMDADDPFDTLSGSTGLTGAADTTLILTTTNDGKVLYGRGRDLAEIEIAMVFDVHSCWWSELGRPCDVFGSDTRPAIRQALKSGKQTPTEIAEASDLDYDLCAKTLQRMTEGGEVQKGGRGRYRLAPDPFAT